MFRTRLTRFALIVTIVLVIAPTLVLAAGIPDRIVMCGNEGQPECTLCDIADTAQNILNTGIYIAIFISAIFFAYAGWKYVTAGGGGDVSAAHSIFLNVAIGLVLILAAWLIIDLIMGTLVKGSPTFIGPWNKVC